MRVSEFKNKFIKLFMIKSKNSLALVMLALVVFAMIAFIGPRVADNFGLAMGFGVAEACCGEDDTGPDGDDNDNPPALPADCQFLTASPTTLPNGGGNVTLNWASRNATSASISGIGSVPVNGSRVVPVTATRTFVLTVAGGQTSDSCTATVTVQPPQAPAECIAFTANPTSLPNGGGNVTLTWSTRNATSASISGIGTVPVNGSRVVPVTATRTFTLTVTGAGGNDSCAATVTVRPPVAPATCDFLTASPTSLPHTGGNVTLSWGTTNATSVSISGVGSVAVDGNTTIFVNSTRTFTLTAVGAGGNDTCAVTVTVAGQPTPVNCDFLNTNKTVVRRGGEDVVLSWGTTGATSASLSGVGSVPVDGSRTVFVDSDRTFTLTANGAAGSDDCSVSIRVENNPVVTPRCDYLRASDSNVEEGDRITLSWETTNADEVRIEPQLGRVDRDGSEDVTINRDTTFTLYARDVNSGREATCSVTVRVDDDNDKVSPRCDLEVSRTRVNRGDRVTLSWETSHADRVRITDDRGNTIVNTTKSSLMDGEIDVVINQTTEFTLNARGEDGGSRTCRVEVKTDDLAVYEKRDQGLVISLTQVPYTGFEAGPMLTAIFYGLLTLWALFVAYILVIKKSSVLGFSLYKNTGMSEAELEHRKKVEALVAKYTGRGL